MYLLKVPFSIRRSDAREQTRITSTCSALVKKNALLKAKDIAGQVKEGVIIGADSVVYLGQKKIIGKPINLRQAKKNLKTLFSRPHWVYTGVAVIDLYSGQEILDYEKTKIYMNHLSDDDIDTYHQIVCPLDKAGGFDIEGYGSLFIRRIEGCYSNVIGLPMARLVGMLKQLDVKIFTSAPD